jgi:type II secretory pathway component GspD/PulD (secretin)
MMDHPHEGMVYHRFQLTSTDVSTIGGLLPANLMFSQPVILKDSNSFIMLLPSGMIDSLSEYLKVIDVESNSYAIELKYITGKDIFDNPPPSINKDNLLSSNNPNIIFFKGNDKRYRSFLKDLEILDRPVPQIRYEVLVMQVQEVDKFDWDFNASASIASSGEQISLLGALGSVLNLNFDIVSQFGYQFAIDLNFSMENSESKIMADTSLNALSGENTHFQNTETYRYRETEIDPDTGDAIDSGVTREITSGLIVEIDGWTSGDGMITMDVKTTISKRDDTSSSSASAIPTTTERSVTTHIRTESGKPVIIGGLMQQDRVKGTQKTPGLGDIPLLGYLFKAETESFQNTEMVVTIVPYLEYPEYSISDVERDIESLYHRFIRN